VIFDFANAKAGYTNVSQAKGQICIQCFQQRGFSGSGAANDKNKFALFHFKTDVTKHRVLLLKDGSFFYAKDGVCGKHAANSMFKIQD
jgi:hypothetical protein